LPGVQPKARPLITNQHIDEDECIMTKPKDFQPHKFARLFPPISDADLKTLAADIKSNGLQEPITIFEDAILDGVNRLKACLIAGVDPTFVPYRGDDPLAFVLSANLHRRHLDASQRAMIASKLATMKQGERTNPKHANLQVSRKTAAARLNVSERSVASAAVVQEHGTPDLIEAVEQGKMAVSTAADLAREPSTKTKPKASTNKSVKSVKSMPKPPAAGKQVTNTPRSVDDNEYSLLSHRHKQTLAKIETLEVQWQIVHLQREIDVLGIARMVRIWHRAHRDEIEAEGHAALMHSLQMMANELLDVAQYIDGRASSYDDTEFNDDTTTKH
jgi:ParB-like chromosome segregation protein Spo0J